MLGLAAKHPQLVDSQDAGRDIVAQAAERSEFPAHSVDDTPIRLTRASVEPNMRRPAIRRTASARWRNVPAQCRPQDQVLTVMVVDSAGPRGPSLAFSM